MIRLTHRDIMNLVEKVRECDVDYEAAAIVFNALYQDELESDLRESQSYERVL